MRRRRWPWVVALGLVALMAGIIFWPRHDDYAFLRALHPTESFGREFHEFGSTTMPAYFHRFEFTQSSQEVRQALIAGGTTLPFTHPYTSGPIEWQGLYQLPSGQVFDLGTNHNHAVTLTVWNEEPTWIQARILAIRGFFHL